jgi:hypothetical protein
MKLLIISFCFFSLSAQAAEIRLETGFFHTVSNRFNIPNPGGTRFGIKEENAKFYGRIQGSFPVSENGSIRILVAPLETGYTFQSSTASVFNGSTFPANTPLEVTYRFNSYRVGYIYEFFSGKNFQAQVGGVGKIRQAKISVNGGGVPNTYSNVGFVPLLNFGFRWAIWNPVELRFDIDGAAAKQGRAFDGSLELFYRLSKTGSGFSGGVRVLEGGAGNEKVNTFALLQYAFASFTYGF